MACEIQFYICPVILILSVFAPPYKDPFLCMTGYNTIKITGVNLGRVKEQRKFINYFLNNIHFYQHNIIFASKIVSSCNLLQHHTTSNILLSSVNIIKLHQWQRLEKKSLWATLMKSQKNWTTFRIMKTDKEIICKFFFTQYTISNQLKLFIFSVKSRIYRENETQSPFSSGEQHKLWYSARHPPFTQWGSTLAFAVFFHISREVSLFRIFLLLFVFSAPADGVYTGFTSAAEPFTTGSRGRPVTPRKRQAAKFCCCCAGLTLSR